ILCLDNFEVADPSILNCIHAKSCVLWFCDGNVLKRCRDAQTLHAYLTDPPGKAVAYEGCSHKPGVQRVTQGNIQGNVIVVYRINHTVCANNTARAHPGLLAILCQRVHTHEMDPFGCHRTEYQHVIAGVEVRGTANTKSTGASRHKSVEDWSRRTLLAPCA